MKVMERFKKLVRNPKVAATVNKHTVALAEKTAEIFSDDSVTDKSAALGEAFSDFDASLADEIQKTVLPKREDASVIQPPQHHASQVADLLVEAYGMTRPQALDHFCFQTIAVRACCTV
jgi:hypothetical protein